MFCIASASGRPLVSTAQSWVEVEDSKSLEVESTEVLAELLDRGKEGTRFGSSLRLRFGRVPLPMGGEGTSVADAGVRSN